METITRALYEVAAWRYQDDRSRSGDELAVLGEAKEGRGSSRLSSPKQLPPGARAAAIVADETETLSTSTSQARVVRLEPADGISLTHPRAAWVNAFGSVHPLDVVDDQTIALPESAEVGYLLARADGHGTGQLAYAGGAESSPSTSLPLYPFTTLGGEIEELVAHGRIRSVGMSPNSHSGHARRVEEPRSSSYLAFHATQHAESSCLLSGIGYSRHAPR